MARTRVEEDLEFTNGDIDAESASIINEGMGAESAASIDEVNALMGAADDVRNAPKVRITIHNQEGPNGDAPVFVAVNGMGYSLPREKVISVPRPIVTALENASEVRYYRDESNNQQFGAILERAVRRIPFTIIP